MNGVGDSGHTALRHAVNGRRPGMANSLPPRGAKLHGEGETYTALEKARGNGVAELVAILERAAGPGRTL